MFFSLLKHIYYKLSNKCISIVIPYSFTSYTFTFRYTYFHIFYLLHGQISKPLEKEYVMETEDLVHLIKVMETGREVKFIYYTYKGMIICIRLLIWNNEAFRFRDKHLYPVVCKYDVYVRVLKKDSRYCNGVLIGFLEPDLFHASEDIETHFWGIFFIIFVIRGQEGISSRKSDFG